MDKEASFYIKKDGGKVQCVLCPMNCIIKDGKIGICRVRENRGGTLYTTIYEEVAAIHMDPIEKKPLYHFYPGSWILSVGTRGCNMSCRFCQNWDLVEAKARGERVTAEALVKAAIREGSIGIAYTYNEPVIWYEFIFETAILAQKNGLKNVLVTNGFINPEPLEEILPYIDAMNIDLKAIRSPFYAEICKAKMEPVKETIKRTLGRCLIEVTNLIVTNHNDTPEEIEQLVDWVASVSPDLPLHFSRYFPDHEMTDPPTPPETLFMAYEIAKKKLNYVYVGNYFAGEAENTYCPNCGNLLIQRRWYKTQVVGLKGRRCARCNHDIHMVN